ncbi:MAG: hypothetical protein HS105_11655 [Chloracidobacterium sp.]|nr:hypothetical protein [Chloracidobacterium sp.]MCC6824763.1 hypothetical protein [Acidobacteriota bacterium]MCO5334277.1 hypothetical protein [Pyrinomonadaceae bacterium]
MVSNAKSDKDKPIKVVGRSWVLDLPADFARENNLEKGTQVLITFKDGDRVSAEVLPPLSKRARSVAEKVMTKRRKVYEELKRIGD